MTRDRISFSFKAENYDEIENFIKEIRETPSI
jgi:hypothetical protein